jgi:hypothetical protein
MHQTEILQLGRIFYIIWYLSRLQFLYITYDRTYRCIDYLLEWRQWSLNVVRYTSYATVGPRNWILLIDPRKRVDHRCKPLWIEKPAGVTILTLLPELIARTGLRWALIRRTWESACRPSTRLRGKRCVSGSFHSPPWSFPNKSPIGCQTMRMYSACAQ